jgi:enamine deaminase RidA (YjgF/YER057c/UK114 family)
MIELEQQLPRVESLRPTAGSNIVASKPDLGKDATMQRTTVNPWQWSLQFGYSQAELVEEQHKVLRCSGQTSVDSEGAVHHDGDMASQLDLVLDNLETVLSEAGMGLSDIVRLNIYTTDVDAFRANAGRIAGRLGEAGARYASTLLGVARLIVPELLVELEATAVQ